MTSAALGTTVTLETFDGEREVPVGPGTQTGHTVTLHELGATRLRGGGRGELFVHLEVETPTALDDEQRELLEQLSRLRGEDQSTGTTLNSPAGSGGFFSRLKDRFSDL
jgi:molecular chaperone DnaJ